MEHAGVGLARPKTVVVETVLQREYLKELAEWIEEARAGRFAQKHRRIELDAPRCSCFRMASGAHFDANGKAKVEDRVAASFPISAFPE
jgi:hypothetical protein